MIYGGLLEASASENGARMQAMDSATSNAEEIIDKLTFQQYFNIVYLGQIIQCSFEIPSDFTIELNKIDMTSPEVNQKSIEISLKICANYPIIDEKTEIPASQTINNTQSNLTAYTDEAVRKV